MPASLGSPGLGNTGPLFRPGLTVTGTGRPQLDASDNPPGPGRRGPAATALCGGPGTGQLESALKLTPTPPDMALADSS